MSYGLGETELERLAREEQERWNDEYLQHVPGAPKPQVLPELIATAKIPPIIILIGVAIFLNWATNGKLFGRGGMWR